MPLPAGVEKVTVSSGVPLTLPDGRWIEGKLIFTGPDLVTVSEDDFTFGGGVSVPLVDGEFSVRLVATDASGMSPHDWTYTVTSKFTNAPNWVRYISLPKANPSVKLDDVLVPDPVAGTYSVLVAGDTLLAKAANLADLADPATARDNLELGSAATADVGTEAGTVAAGDDGRFTGSRPPSGPAGGDLAGTYPDPEVVAVNGVSVSGTPATGQVLTATGDDAAQWADPSGGSPDWVFDVTDYGAIGDAQVVADGAIGAGVAVLTSATANWPSSVVGKPISVKGAGPNGITTLVTTVASRQSATQITLNAVNASGGAVSGAVIIWGTDDTAAIQAAVDAAEAYLANHTYAQVYFPPRRYVIAGPLNNTKSGNGQIVWGPYAMTGDQRTLHFAGAGIAAPVRSWLQTVPLTSGACLISLGLFSSTSAQISNINADGNPAVLCGPNEGWGYGVAANFSNMLAAITNLSIVTAHSSFGLTYGAANLWGCAKAHIDGLSYGTAGTVTSPTDYTSPGVFGTGLSAGLLLPAPGNNDHVKVPNVSCNGGYTYAAFVTEHLDGGRYMALYCWAGIVIVGTYAGSVGSVHAMKMASASIEACINEVYILGAGSSGIGPIIHIDQLSTESSTPNIAGQAAHMAAARGRICWTGIFNEAGLTHDQPTGIESVNGQASSDVRTVTATTTARPIDRVIKADATSGGITVNLPSAAPNPVTYTIIKSDVSGNTVTIDPFGSQTINGSATKVLSAQWETVTLRSDGTNWIAI